jgi:hypothetical protein
MVSIPSIANYPITSVIKTWLKHNILDYCIDEIFGSVIKNFKTPNQRLTRVSDLSFNNVGSHCITVGMQGTYICTIVPNTLYSMKYTMEFPKSLMVSSGLTSSKYAFVPVKHLHVENDQLPTMIYLRPDEHVELLSY